MSGMNENLPTREQIEQRARQIYMQRGSQNSDPLADWLAAEKELMQSSSVPGHLAGAPSTNCKPQRGPTFMFLDFFGLREQPFGMTPDPAYLYCGRTHSEALTSLSQGIADNRGFFALIAQPGMGKTTLLYRLLDELRDSARTALVSQTLCNPREFVEYILLELGVDARGMGLVAMHGKLNEILFGELLAGRRFVLVVDEAQNLDDSVLETVRMLSNFETHNAKLLQIVLAGQPRLAAKLAQPKLVQLRQRIAVLSHLEPFTPEETGLYIEHRLKVAGHSGDAIFDRASIDSIARHSDGIPRNINNLCYNSLLLASKRGLALVTYEIVQEAAASLDMESLISEPMPMMVADPVPPPVPLATPVAVPEPQTVPQSAPESSVLEPAVPESSAPVSYVPPSVPLPAPLTVPVAVAVPAKTAHPAKTFLSYGAKKKASSPKWPLRAAILTVVLLSGTLAIAILGRSQSRKGIAPATFNDSSSPVGALVPADRSEGAPPTYDAAPLETGSGEVLTVVAGSQQSLKDLSIRYAGHFDSEISSQILSLNPDLKDPDHLEAGQLVRIPLPPGAIRKANDTGEAVASDKPEKSESLFSRLSALLRTRK